MHRFVSCVSIVIAAAVVASACRIQGLLTDFKETAGADPLADWLASLHLRLEDITIKKILEVKVTDLVCTGVSFGGIDSQVDLEPPLPSIYMSVGGIRLDCSAKYSTSLLSGSLTAQVLEDSLSKASMTFDFRLTKEGVIDRVEVAQCDVKMKFIIKFEGGILKYVPGLAGLLADKMEQDVRDKSCSFLKEFAATNMTEEVRKLNDFLLPKDMKVHYKNKHEEGHAPGLLEEEASSDGLLEEEGSVDDLPEEEVFEHLTVQRHLAENEDEEPSSMVQEAESEGEDGPRGGKTIDWRNQKALEWSSWLFGRVLGPTGLNRMMQYITNDTGNLSLPGFSKPIASRSLKLSIAQLRLESTLWLEELQLEGLDNFETIKPLGAASATELETGALLGDKAFGLGANFRIRLEAFENGSPEPSTVEEHLKIHVALLGPTFDSRVEVQCGEAQWKQRHTLAQWYVDGPRCLASFLQASPKVKSLNMSFKGLAPDGELKVAFTNITGTVERNIATLLNNAVDLFNHFYEKYLPSAVDKHLGSASTLAQVNGELSRLARPSTCTQKQLALNRVVKELSESYANWPALLGGIPRMVIDNLADGFVRHNDTLGEFEKPLMHHIEPFQTSGGLRSTLDLDVMLKEAHITGMDKVGKLRLLEPDPKDPAALSFSLDSSCSTAKAPWRPSSQVVGEVTVKGQNTTHGSVEFSPPCGEFEARMQAKFNTQKLFGLTLEPSNVICMIGAMSELNVSQLTARMTDSGELLARADSHPARDVFGEMCTDHPKFCELLDDVGQQVKSPAALTKILNQLRGKASQLCERLKVDKNFFKAAFVAADEKDDADDKPLLTEWLMAIIATVVLTSLCAGVATSGAGGGRIGTRSLAANQWLTPHPAAKAQTIFVCFLISAAVVMRVMSIFVFTVASVEASIVSPYFHGGEVQLQLISFGFFSLVDHFWESSAYMCATLLVLSSLLMAHFVVLSLLFLWTTSFFARARGTWLKIAIFLGRLPLIDVAFFSMAMASLNNDVAVGLGLEVEVQLRNRLHAGVYTGVVSLLMAQISCLILQEQVKKLDETEDQAVASIAAATGNSVSWQKYAKWLKLICCAFIFLGLPVWMFFYFMHVQVSEVAGTLIPPQDVSGSGLFGAVFKGDFFLFLPLLLTGLIAPLLQAGGSSMMLLSERAYGFGYVCAQLGNALTIMEVLAGAYLFAYVPEIDGFARWIARAKFNDICDVFVTVSGQDCLGFTPSVDVPGTLGLVFATGGSLILAASPAVGDLISLCKRSENQEAQPQDSEAARDDRPSIAGAAADGAADASREQGIALVAGGATSSN